MADSLMYLDSIGIQVFPTSRRDDMYDRNARLNTEQNLVSIINRLTSQSAFIVDGLDVAVSGNNLTISEGSCNIHGYLFKITHNITWAATNLGTGSTASFVIELSTQSVGAEITFAELIGTDTTVDNRGTYNGLKLKVLAKDEVLPAGSYKLDLAIWDGSKWVVNENARLKYQSKDMMVKAPSSMFAGEPLTGTGVETSLTNWIDNFIIDDGEL